MDMVGGIPTPLKHMSSSVGMMTFPTEWKNKIHLPNHQAVVDWIPELFQKTTAGEVSAHDLRSKHVMVDG